MVTPAKCQHIKKGIMHNQGAQVCTDSSGNVWQCALYTLQALQDFDQCGEGPLVCDKAQSQATDFLMYDVQCGPVKDICVLTNPHVVKLPTDKCKDDPHPIPTPIPTPIPEPTPTPTPIPKPVPTPITIATTHRI